ncbi:MULTISPECIES: peptide ligase PGM1-related protein [unclassified Synechococcus]|uniref:peptide ligase PGM1-related protein n=1 Tax=unclassified Synechococcus TaxID=2626047 RepID=UPI002AD4FBA1|nr:MULTISPECIES: peptide ligase PGM1-related protein [unclassified Synechococcus]MEA5422320.1 peptide ligase PGM1-related protein [Synechococcus sp. CCY9202]CAK6699120.1 L-propargylglycine--L-glutamate ligase [Synechococcus sp. CBW1107]
MALSFAELQAQLRQGWGGHWGDHGDRADARFDQLVVPSLTMEEHQIQLVTGVHHYEERQLFNLIRLRHPGVRVVYVTSTLLPELVVDAVLELLPGMPASHARRRLHLFDTNDASPRPLTAKLLERPALLARIREQLRPGRSFLSCYTVTDLERSLSERLQVPLLGCDPALAHWGTKAGSRELFARCGVPHPPGSGVVFTLEDLAAAAVDLWDHNPGLRRLVVKLNEGFSGEGNARLDLKPLDLPGHSAGQRLAVMRQALERLPMPSQHWLELLARQGALVEAWLEGGEQQSSPSVQGMIHPDGFVEVLSTHEQRLGGSSGQTFEGCSFPAHAAYRQPLMEMGRLVGEALAAEGALERYAVDVVARRFSGHWDLQAIEVNLRQGGTTHPFMALRHTTSGRLDPATGAFLSPSGQALYYEATDNLCDPRLRGLLPEDLIDLVAEAGLHFDPAHLRGSLFHLLGCLSQYGKLGMTCIGRSPEEAAAVYQGTQEALLRGAGRLQG